MSSKDTFSRSMSEMVLGFRASASGISRAAAAPNLLLGVDLEPFMSFYRFPFAMILTAGVLVGCASERPVTAASDPRACATNFAVTGSMLSGQTFTSFEEHSGANKSVVFERVVRTLTTKGYNVTSANKDLGIVSALNPIIMGKGSRATLNVAVSDSQNRVRVDTAFAIPGLTGTSTSAVRDEFCAILRDAFSTA
jgi:hypothetical protein